MIKHAPKIKISFQDKAPALVRWGVYAFPTYSVAIGFTEKGDVCRVSFMRGREPSYVLHEWQRVWKRTTFIHDQKLIDKKARSIFSKQGAVDLVMTGTKFQQSVWKQLAHIASGKTLSYGEVAARLGKPRAARAVGTACGANPVAVLIPCHRVIAGQGALGGFGGGLEIKKTLLRSEGVRLRSLEQRS